MSASHSLYKSHPAEFRRSFIDLFSDVPQLGAPIFIFRCNPLVTGAATNEQNYRTQASIDRRLGCVQLETNSVHYRYYRRLPTRRMPTSRKLWIFLRRVASPVHTRSSTLDAQTLPLRWTLRPSPKCSQSISRSTRGVTNGAGGYQPCGQMNGGTAGGRGALESIEHGGAVRTRTDPQNTPVEVKRTHSSAAIEQRIFGPER